MGKLIAIDIDGTLYNDKKEITPRTRAALLRAQDRGSTVILASGRPMAGLLPIAEQLEMKKHHGLLLAYNGAMVTDCSNGEIVYQKTLPIDLAKRILRHLESYPVTPIVDDGYAIYTNEPDGFQIAYESASNHLRLRVVENVCAAVDFSPAKVLIAAPKEVLAFYRQDIERPFAEEASFILSAPMYLEATSKGVGKADSLHAVCEKWRVAAADIVAFGDAQNDLSMLDFAGTGIAMGNACAALKEIADRTTATNNEDGIAAALEEMGLC